MLTKIKRFSKEKRALFVFCCALVSIILITLVIIAAYGARVISIKANGLELRASKDFEVLDIRYFLQNDPEWSGDLIGDTNRTMGSSGCLITCIASAIDYLGVPATPGEVNKKLTEVGGFQDADLIWYKINEAFPEIDYKYTRVFSSSGLERDLENGLLPIVNVKLNGAGASHWLLIIGAKDREFLAYDPLNPDKEPIKLSQHGDVYSYRVLVRAG